MIDDLDHGILLVSRYPDKDGHPGLRLRFRGVLQGARESARNLREAARHARASFVTGLDADPRATGVEAAAARAIAWGVVVVLMNGPAEESLSRDRVSSTRRMPAACCGSAGETAASSASLWTGSFRVFAIPLSMVRSSLSLCSAGDSMSGRGRGPSAAGESISCRVSVSRARTRPRSFPAENE